MKKKNMLGTVFLLIVITLKSVPLVIIIKLAAILANGT